ncbi:ribonuclease H-like domain-containing protein [Tanacetum coccineum]
MLINNLDVGNPLHMHPNDSTSTTMIPFKLQGSENYRIWSSAMKLALHARNKYAFIDRSCVKSAYVTKLESTYDKVDGSVIYNLLQKISSIKQGGSSIADYYHRLNSLWREFGALTKLPTCTCDANKELGLHNQLMKLMQFLMGLDDCYESVRSALLTRDPLPEVKDVYITVFREESHRGIPESSNVTESKINATSFAAKGYPPGFKKVGNPIKQSGFKQNFNSNSDVKSNKKQQSFASQSSAYSSFNPQQMRKLLCLINDTLRTVHANMLGRASFFNGNVYFNINFTKLYSVNSKLCMKTITMGWIIDPGANQYLILSTVGMFNIVDISNLKIIVGHPNGTLATVSHVGNLKLTCNVILYDVLVVPGYCVSMLSVNKLMKDNKLFVGFDEDKCYIQDLKKKITLGTGSESGGLYLIDMELDNNIGKVNMVVSCHVSKDLWHNRLGYPADQVLNVLKIDLNLTKSTSVSACEVCHMGKTNKGPFPLIHLDLWGPYRVTSRERLLGIQKKIGHST